MPELISECTPAPAPPPVPPGLPLTPPPATEEEDEKPIGPPIIDPARFEDFPVFRECFLYYISGAESNATLRAFGDLFYQLILEYWEYWPHQPEGTLRAGLRAAIADLRHVQGFLLEWTGPEHEPRHRPRGAPCQGGGRDRPGGGQARGSPRNREGPWRGEA